MKKTVIGLLVGLIVGVMAARWYAHTPESAEKGKADAAAKPEEKPKENPLHLPADKRTAAGITLAKPSEVTLAPEVQAFGRVLDPTALATAAADVETTRTALAASEKELQRVQKLFAAGGNATAQAVEAAEATVARDRGALAAARVRMLAGWGRELASVADLRYVTEALEKGRSLVRIDLLLGESAVANPKTAKIGLTGSKEAFDAEIIGGAPTADPQI